MLRISLRDNLLNVSFVNMASDNVGDNVSDVNQKILKQKVV